MVQTTLSQYYNKINIVFDNFAVEVYLHAFPATALDGGLLLTSNPDGYFPVEKNTGTYWIRGMAWQNTKDEMNRWMYSSTIMGTEQRSSRP